MNRDPVQQTDTAVFRRAFPWLWINAPSQAGTARQPQSEYSRQLDDAYDLFCRLVNSGQAVDPIEFCAKYPVIHDSLVELIRAHRLVHDKCDDSVVECPQVDSPQVEWPQTGDFFAGFHLGRELGRGAFARVFQATESALGGRQVALKIASRPSAEAAILGRMAHPNIVPVFSVSVEQKTGLTAVCM